MLKTLLAFALLVVASAGRWPVARAGRWPVARAGCDWCKIEECATGVERTWGNDGCPSCRRPRCTRKEKQECRTKEPLPACEEGTKPVLEDCCPSCKPIRAVCTSEEILECEADMSSLPECIRSPGMIRFNASSCCPTCQAKSPKKKNKCTREDKKTCRKNSDVCAENETPMRQPDACCKTCHRPASEVRVRDVAKCAKEKLDECTGDQKPNDGIETCGFTCPVCRRRKPTCPSACGKKKVCVRRRKYDAQGKCRRQRWRKVTLRAQNALDKVFLKSANESEFQAMFTEFVERFCEDPDNTAKCEFRSSLVDGLQVKIKKPATEKDETVVVEVQDSGTEEDGDAARRMLLSADDMASLLSDALADPDATDGFIATVDESETMSSAQSVVASSALVFALAVLIL